MNNNIDKRCEEIGGYSRDKKKYFELENRSELQHIASLRGNVFLEQVVLDMKKLNDEKKRSLRNSTQLVHDQIPLITSVNNGQRSHVRKIPIWMNDYEVTRINQFNNLLTHFALFSYSNHMTFEDDVKKIKW